jgi:hypothetical protein
MNPPPLPPPLPGNRNSFAHQAAIASLVSPLLAVFVSVATAAATRGAGASSTGRLITGGICVLLIIAGVVLAIVALCGIPQFGRRGLLGRSIAGLVVNGGLMFFMVTGLVVGIKRAAEGRKAAEDIQVSSQELRTSVQQSYDPEKGITNFDAGRLDRLGGELKSASQKLSGDDARVMEVMGNHVKRMQNGLKKYEAALTSFREAEVLRPSNLKEQSQIEPRREIVRAFLVANSGLKQIIADSEKAIRADLVRAKVAPAKTEALIRGFNSKAAPRNALTLKIRDCDQRMGDAVLGALDLFDAHWGNWRFEPAANRIDFAQALANDAYNGFLDEINAASREQIELQGKLVKLP